jgi:hypothetical protein
MRRQLLGAAQTATIWIEVMHGRGRHALDVELRHFNHMLMVSRSVQETT